MPSVEPKQEAGQDPDEEEEPEEVSWNLGFAEEPEKPHLLLRHHFPSKVGGRPAWLDPVRLPSREALTCGASGRPLDFLLQVYAPVDANPVEGFHRALFLFISPEGSRLKEPGAVRLFRCQLPRQNPYYAYDPPRERDKQPPPLQPADAEASRDRDPWRAVDAERPPASSSASSSSPSSSSAKRRGGGSAASRGAAGSTAASELAAAPAAALPRAGVRGPGGLYPELELVVEPEDDYREEDEDGDGDEWEEVRAEAAEAAPQQGGQETGGSGRGRGGSSGGGGGGGGAGGGGVGAAAAAEGAGRQAAEAGGARGVEAEVRRALRAYRERVAAEGELDDEELPPDVVEALEGGLGPEQRCFVDFQARVSWAPEQVIRYCFQDGAQPLWPAPHRRPGPGDIPPCPHCGSARKFEFQVLPQLLHYLALDEEDPASPDWSTLVAYTCGASCSPPPGADCAYLEEHVWVQPPAP